MTQQLVQSTTAGPLAAFADRLPPMIASADDRTAWRFVDFFAVTIRNPNTREAYYRAVSRFMGWCEQRGLNRLAAIRPMSRAGGVPRSKPSLTSPKQLGPAPQWPGMTAPDGGLVPLRQAPCTHSLGVDPRPPGLLRPAGPALHRPGGGPDPDPGVVCAPLATRGHPVSGTGQAISGGADPSGRGDPAPVVGPGHRPHHTGPGLFSWTTLAAHALQDRHPMIQRTAA